jgi:hypothetical protein
MRFSNSVMFSIYVIEYFFHQLELTEMYFLLERQGKCLSLFLFTNFQSKDLKYRPPPVGRIFFSGKNPCFFFSMLCCQIEVLCSVVLILNGTFFLGKNLGPHLPPLKVLQPPYLCEAPCCYPHNGVKSSMYSADLPCFFSCTHIFVFGVLLSPTYSIGLDHSHYGVCMVFRRWYEKSPGGGYHL